MAQIEWLETADEDLNQIYNYIYKDSVHYASKTIIDIIENIENLEIFPYSGRKVCEYSQENLRELIYKSYRLIYEINENEILIHRIWHSARKMHKRILS